MLLSPERLFRFSFSSKLLERDYYFDSPLILKLICTQLNAQMIKDYFYHEVVKFRFSKSK